MTPNAILIGAPKCSTSSVFKWLDAHPACMGSTPKETFFFLDPGHPLLAQENYHSAGEQLYDRFFPNHNGEKIVFEATTHYLYHRTPLEYFASRAEKPKIMAVLRKPEQRVLSSFLYSRNNLAAIDSGVTFSEFVDASLSGNIETLQSRFHSEATWHVLKRDVEYSCYAKYIQGWLDAFGRENVHIMLFYQVASDPRQEMRNLATFLGVEPGFYDNYDFERFNQTRSVSAQTLHRLALRIRDRIPRIPILHNTVRRAYFAMQERIQTSVREDFSDGLRKLHRYFAPFNEELEQATGIDLSVWRVRP